MEEVRENKKNILDENFADLDKANMIGALEEFPQNIKDALQLGEEFSVPTDFFPVPSGKFKNIVVLGMGGSAIGGDLLSNYLANELPIPMVVIRGYSIPKFVGKNSLVFAVSYSGNTEETISALSKCVEVEAKVIALSSGGWFAKLSQDYNFPLIKVPSGIQPRAALGYLFFPILKVLEGLNLIKERTEELEEMINILQELSTEYGSKSLTQHNFAKQIALSLHQYLPLIYGSEGLFEAVTMRWKTQINENSKWPCFWNIFSELDHNEIVGYEIENQINKQAKIVYLEDKEGNPRISQRCEITKKIIGEKVAEFILCPSKGKGKLARMFSIIYLGDMVSCYLAILNKVDPSPVACIENLKKELAK
ncbi:MAG: bifunctional phosphoglucose/phosphomannose isomerase [Candidatus Atribacteria bacterium]